MSLKLDLLKVDNWAQLPNPWKSVKKISKVNYTNNIEDKGLAKIVVPYCSTDDLRPAMTGVNFSSVDIVATDANVLISLPSKNVKEGLYMLNPSKAKKGGSKLHSKMDDRFPDYKVILSSENNIVTEVDIYKLKTYCQAVINGNYSNQYTHQVSILVNDAYKDAFVISFNAEFLITVLDSFLMLGHDKIFAGFVSKRRAVTFSTDRDAAKQPSSFIGVYPIALCMPLLLDGDYENTVGAQDVDFDTEIKAYYSFEDSEIHNADKSIARFDYDLNSKSLPYMDESIFKLLSKAAGKYKTLPILDNVAIKDAVAWASDLTTTISISGINIENGCYQPLNGALKGKLLDAQVDDFPKNQAIVNSGNFLGSINASILHKYISQSDKFIGDDVFRAAQQGVNLKIEKGTLEIAATNQYILYSVSISSNIKDFNVTVPNSKFFSDALEVMGYTELSIYYGGNDIIQFSNGLITVSFRVIDSKFPEYKSIIGSTNKYLSFDRGEVLSIIGSLNSADLKKILFFNFGNQAKNSGYADLIILGEYDENKSEYKDVKSVGKIKCDNVSKVNNINENISLIMPINIGEYSENGFGFNPKYLKTLLSFGDGNIAELLYDSESKSFPQFLQKINTIEPKDKIVKIEKVEIVEPNTDDIKVSEKVEIKVENKGNKKELALSAIRGLQLLADKGNIKAIAAIKGLRLLV